MAKSDSSLPTSLIHSFKPSQTRFIHISDQFHPYFRPVSSIFQTSLIHISDQFHPYLKPVSSITESEAAAKADTEAQTDRRTDGYLRTNSRKIDRHIDRQKHYTPDTVSRGIKI
ncbi:hypothetical protein DPMN_087076 [Dreissena polymorpha]|uniref:Uncharacterized protein n=1 Tax=Dreissena polymorpha TaxID=45954 RepID=A0A9D4QV96_DREPO|nr:hypothetical protein DPMN_087076 [Dreissena polymorpha]